MFLNEWGNFGWNEWMAMNKLVQCSAVGRGGISAAKRWNWISPSLFHIIIINITIAIIIVTITIISATKVGSQSQFKLLLHPKV